MSHSRQRKDKICLNCTAALQGRYCHECGQENVEPKETVWSLVIHFLYDITHFDGKFFSTVRYLLFKPGFLSREYIRGRRATYLHPVRMYVFTSAMFFIYFFSQVKIDHVDLNITGGMVDTIANELESGRREILADVNSRRDSAIVDKTVNSLQRGISEIRDSAAVNDSEEFFFLGLKYKSKREYDSIQNQLPPDARDSKSERTKILEKIEKREKMRADPQAFLKDAGNELLHKFPQLLFISLPFFALLLKWLYSRRKDIYYTEHGIFSIHLYIFMFIAIFFLLLTDRLRDATSMNWLRYLEAAILLLIFFYTYKAMRNFYQQGRLKTFFKFLLLHFMSALLMFLLFLSFVVLAIYEI